MPRPDADFRMFADLSEEVSRALKLEPDTRWDESPFGWLASAPPARKGAVGKTLVRRWAEAQGWPVNLAPGEPHDLVISGRRVIVRTSTLWAEGDFVFQQLRHDPFDVAFFLGLAPADVQLWCAPSAVLDVEAPGQHTGASARETRWIRFDAAAPPGWLQRYGGTLAEARRSFLEQAGGEI